MQQFTDAQLHIVEAALRYSLDQVRDSEIKILDWGDGAVHQLHGGEDDVIAETELLLDDTLAATQHAKDEYAKDGYV